MAAVQPQPIRRIPTEVRDTLSWLAHLIDDSLPLRVAEDEDEYAHRHLGGSSSTGLVAVRERLSPFTAPIVARAFAADLKAHPPYDVAGRYSDESPIWDRLRVDDTVESVPCSLVAAFAAGTLVKVPVVVVIETRWNNKEIVVHARADDGDVAEAYLQRLLARARGAENYLRGRCLDVRASGNNLDARPVATPPDRRDDVVLPASVWAEIDLNVAALFGRRALLGELGLGTNRGLLLSGPPGTGKTAVCRVLAAELAGDVTVVLCTAGAIAGHLNDLYEEVARLAPALVVLEDLDLVVGRRKEGRDTELHDFLTALDGAMTRQDVVTVATTNDPRALDEAATRAARFDRIVEVALPEAPQRTAILRRYLGRLASAVDVEAITTVTAGASGADLRELVRRAVLAHADDVTTAMLLDLVRGGAWSPAAVGQYL